MFFTKKSIFIIICFTMICVTVQAQIDKNTWTVGGTLDLGIELGARAGSLDHFQIQPKIGYFPIKHLQVGGIALVDYQKINRNEATLQTGFGPFLRYYIKTAKKVSPYINTEVIFTSFETFFYNENSSFARPKETLLRPGIGLAVFITPHVVLENQVTFEYTNAYGGEWSFMQFSVGFQAHLYRKSEK